MPVSRVGMKMPPHYPPYYDYSDIDLGIGSGILPSPTITPEHSMSSALIISLVVICVVVFLSLLIWALGK